MTEKVSYHWKPIDDLPANWSELEDKQLPVIAELWQTRHEELKDSESLRQFNEKLARKWSIETGAIEGIYRIDRGTTELLIEKGIEASLIRHGTTSIPAEELVQILGDQAGALNGIFDFVANRRELSTSYIKELHQELCASQDKVVGRDPNGNIVHTKLLKGEWKKQPNNPHRKDGEIHEYCPPEQVASEMDKLIDLHLKHVDLEIPPEIESAWLHHRFTQIHPFQDGNGRVARSLASLILLRAKLFPFIVETETQGKYIESLETADSKNDLKPLISIVSKQQQKALRNALDISRDVIREQEQDDTLNQKLLNVVQKISNKTRERQQADFHNVESKANSLVEITMKKFEDIKNILQEKLSSSDASSSVSIMKSEVDQSRWYNYQVIQVAKELGYFANNRAWSKWARLLIKGEFGGQIVFSFHQHGKDFKGLFICTAFFQESDQDKSAEDKVFYSLVDEGFVVSLNEDSSKMEARFHTWLDEVLENGIDHWLKAI